MKSEEEFIAGIYEKASAYTEEKQHKVMTLNFSKKVSGMAAALAVCLCLAGISGSMLHPEGPAEQGMPGTSRMAGEQDNGIAMHSDDAELLAEIPFVTGEVCLKEVSLKGTVKEFKEEEQIALVLLESFGEKKFSETQAVVAAIRFTITEKLYEEKLAPGIRLEVCAKMTEEVYKTAEEENLLLFEVTRQETIRMEDRTSGE